MRYCFSRGHLPHIGYCTFEQVSISTPLQYWLSLFTLSSTLTQLGTVTEAPPLEDEQGLTQFRTRVVSEIFRILLYTDSSWFTNRPME